MSDRFSRFSPTLETPFQSGFAITPNNSVPLAYTTRAIYVAENGNLEVVMVGYDDTPSNVLFTAVKAGDILPLRCTYVRATNTTSSNSLVGLY